MFKNTPLENIALGKYGRRKSKNLNAKDDVQTFSSQSILYKTIRQLSESLLSELFLWKKHSFW